MVIQWVAAQTRPDLLIDSLELGVERNKATLSTMKLARKVIKKLKLLTVKMKAIGQIPKLCVYPDAGFCSLLDDISDKDSLFYWKKVLHRHRLGF